MSVISLKTCELDTLDTQLTSSDLIIIDSPPAGSSLSVYTHCSNFYLSSVVFNTKAEHCSYIWIWGAFYTFRFSLLLGCMLCFGQSAFFRFNHPEEALRMKSLLPGGLNMPRTQPAGKDENRRRLRLLSAVRIGTISWAHWFSDTLWFFTQIPISFC